MTPVGRLLRRFSLDELPQLFNVLRGEMSLVGPRPLPQRDYERLEDWHKKRYLVLPGITGLWQVSGRSELDFDDLVRLDFLYLERWSVFLDLTILRQDGAGGAHAPRRVLSTVLVTGATDGLGRALAKELVARDHDVLVHGRSQERIDETVAELGSPRVRAYRADLSSLAEVRELARAVREREERLDVLVNNAGLARTGRARRAPTGSSCASRSTTSRATSSRTSCWASCGRSAPSRIVNVASAGQQALDFSDLQLERDYSGVRAYCQSKLAQILFTVDLAGELEGSGVTVTALHPATYMPTKMVRSPISTLQEGVDATLRLVRGRRWRASAACTSTGRPRRAPTRRPTTPTRAGPCARRPRR